MRNLVKILFAAFGASALLMACDTLDQRAKSTFEDPEVYSNYTLSRMSVNCIYESYVTMASYRTEYFYGYGCNTDAEVLNDMSNSERNNPYQYKQNPLNQNYNNAGDDRFYSGNFKGIERANVCIDGLETYGDIDNRREMGRLYGEALTARALLYADLMNVFGEVPARFKPATKETIYLPKADKDELYKHLLHDLDKAAKYLDYDVQELITQPGKACARGLYARLALQAAGYSCRPDEGMVNHGGFDNSYCHNRRSNDPELQPSVLYPKALAALEDVIQHANLSLFDNFEDLWKWYCDLNTEYGKEIIFGMPFSDNRGHHLTRNGVPNYKYFANGQARVSVAATLYFDYDPLDTRRDVTCEPFFWDEDGIQTFSNKSLSKTASLTRWYNGKFRFDWMIRRPLPSGQDPEDGAKFPVLRYADILLMASEIANELGDIDKAKDYMRPVLQRAFHDDVKVTDYLDRLQTKEEFFQAIKDQRRFEFCGELLRRQDLIRWGCLKSALDDFKAELSALGGHTGKFTYLTGSGRNFIYWRTKDNSTDAEFYGFEPDDTENKTTTEPNRGWQRKSYFNSVSATYTQNLYLEDPDMNMYMPIPGSVIIANLGVLQNDYGYAF